MLSILICIYKDKYMALIWRNTLTNCPLTLKKNPHRGPEGVREQMYHGLHDFQASHF